MDTHMGKSGYLDIKFQSKGKGLKKGWRRKWITMNPLTDHCECRTVIKLQTYPDAASSKTRRQSRGNVMTMYLDNVTDVRRITTSRSHAYAFQIVEYEEDEEPVMFLAGENETVTQNWMTFLRAAFWKNTTIVVDSLPALCPDMFVVTVVDNEHSKRLNLFGDYLLYVTPESFQLASAPDGATRYEWRLRSLMRFAIIEAECDADINRLFVIIAGPSALKGAGSFKFFTTDAGKVLHCIHETINVAIAAKKEAAKAVPTVPSTTAIPCRNERKASIDSFASEPSRTPPKISAQSRNLSLPVSCELMSYEDKIRLDACSASVSGEDFRDGVSFQSGSSGSSNGRFLQFDSKSTRSGTPSPQSNRQRWKNYSPPINQANASNCDGDKNNRTTSVSSTGSRDSGVVLDSNSDFASRTNVWVEEASQQSTDRLSDIHESDSRQTSLSDISYSAANVFPVDDTGNNESDITRSHSFHQGTQHEHNETCDQRRFTSGTNSSLPRSKRTKKISDVYIDLDSILAAKAELDLKLGRANEEVKIEEARPPPLPPFPPLLKPLVRKSVQLRKDDLTKNGIEAPKGIVDHLQVTENKLSRSRKTSRSRKLSNTSNIYFEVGSLSDIAKGCADKTLAEQKTAETSSDNEATEKRDRKVSNLYLDLDTVALLRTESFQNSPYKMDSLTPPELPPREPSPRQKEKMKHPGSYEEVDRYRKNLAQFLGSPSYPTKDIPPELPQRPTTLRPSKKATEPTSTVFSSIFGTLTRRKKRLNSADNQPSPSSNKAQPRKVQSVPEWPLPVVDSKVADNELYSPSSDEEFDVIDSISENVFDENEEPPPPFPPLVEPMNKVWYNSGDNNNSTNSIDTETSARSPDSRKSYCIAEEDEEQEASEESFYMSMSGGNKLIGTSQSSSEADVSSLNATNASSESFIQSEHENPYLLMSNPEGNETDAAKQESDLYMNMGQLCGTFDA